MKWMDEFCFCIQIIPKFYSLDLKKKKNCILIIIAFNKYSHLTQQELHRRYEGTPESTKTKALQTVIDMKVQFKKIFIFFGKQRGHMLLSHSLLFMACRMQN